MKSRFPLYAFAAVQVLDATFTYVGIERGFTEGNPMLAALMSSVGVVAALAIAKSAAIACGAFIFAHGRVKTLIVLTSLYVAAAIVPWTVLLFGV